MHSEAVDRLDWRHLALDPPAAHGGPAVRAQLRATPEDFEVDELLGFAADGGRAHRLVLVEKRSANTLFVARRLAAAANVAVAEVGFAGLKDRHALARQWFSLPAGADPVMAGYAGDGFRVLDVQPHSRKLRRGALLGNRFRLRLRGLAGDHALLAERLATVAARGVPNYFGAQRFGRAGASLEQVRQWLASGRLPAGREPRAFVLSAARALGFNAVLAARVGDGSWDRLLPGEVVSLAGSASVFVAGEPDSELVRRCAGHDLHPSGPLPGSAGLGPQLAAGQLEQEILARLAPLPAALATAGLRAARRALRLCPRALGHQLGAGQLELEFELPRGAFATAVVRELAATDALPGADE